MTVADPSATQTRNDDLLQWYRENRRDLPWRRSTDPYLVLVSEIMLQQTQVGRVIPRFEAFIERWPSAADLASASNEDVLSEWSGLGYNSRALRLRDAARVAAEDGWPTSSRDLTSLPGVGPYTAAAIASICFAEQIAALDTNLRRVLSRWYGEPLDGPALADFAAAALGTPAGDWNQAIMDLGSRLCTPVEPGCGRCPVAASCSDPEVYQPPPKQAPFAGSKRQLRGAVLRAHLNGDDPIEAGIDLGWNPEETMQTIETLIEEGLVTER